MSTNEGAAPMEEEEETPCDNGPPSPDNSMDWVKISDADGMDTQEAQDKEANAPHAVATQNRLATETTELSDNVDTVAEGEKVMKQSENVGTIAKSEEEDDLDEYSFGSSDEDDEDDDGLNKMAYVSLNSSFDMSILESSISMSKDALDLVVGKDVVMVVGKTGVGKSTLLQGIAGKKIQRSFHSSSCSGQTSTKAVFDAQDALPSFEIGHAKVSKTRSLSAFRRVDGLKDVVYLDSPGLEDTRGIEMDIANSVLLSQVAKRCSSLRFVVLIHCASLLEDRGNAFDLALSLIDLLLVVSPSS